MMSYDDIYSFNVQLLSDAKEWENQCDFGIFAYIYAHYLFIWCNMVTSIQMQSKYGSTR